VAAIVARKSTEQVGVTDEQRSVTRQVEHARAYALAHGWIVLDEYIFVDDGISGAEFRKRPGLTRLLNALRPRPPFQVLVMSEESRLGREQIETAYIIKQILDAGVRIFYYLDDRERTLDSATDKVILSIAGFASEIERERAQQRTHDALLRLARHGYVTGGKVYGYDNVRASTPGLSSGTHRAPARRVINPPQAAVVHRIFQWSADGWGITRIAKQLNAEGISPPRGAPMAGLRPPSARCSTMSCTAGGSSGIARGSPTEGVRRPRRLARPPIASRSSSRSAESCRTNSGMPHMPRSIGGRGSSCPRPRP